MGRHVGVGHVQGDSRSRCADLGVQFDGRAPEPSAAIRGQDLAAAALENHEFEGLVDTELAWLEQIVDAVVRQPRPTDGRRLVLIVARLVRTQLLGDSSNVVVHAVAVVEVAVADEEHTLGRGAVELHDCRLKLLRRRYERGNPQRQRHRYQQSRPRSAHGPSVRIQRGFRIVV